MKLPLALLDAIDHFSRLPGVGEKTALRYCLALSEWSEQEVTCFGNAIIEIARIKKCVKCGMFAQGELCEICINRSENRTICIVENVADLLALERSETFGGRYHVLGGVINPLLGVGPRELGLDEMVKRFVEEGVEEIILAINPSVEGDATCSYIKQILPNTMKIDRIGLGIPVGGSLEYLDAMTIGKALENKKRY